MNDTEKKELLDLAEILKGIADGRPWDTHWNNEWTAAPPHLTPVQCLRSMVPIRLKPWTLPPPPEGKQWHRGAEFTEADLPEGYRPLLVGETILETDEVRYGGKDGGAWGEWLSPARVIEPRDTLYRLRTKRPLPVGATVAPGVWCGPVNTPDPYAELKAAAASGKQIQYRSSGVWSDCYYPAWDAKPEFYRVKPDPVPLCKDDIPPNSVIRNLSIYPDNPWRNIEPLADKIVLTNSAWISYPDLMREGWEILRPGQDWQPCSKDAP